MKRPANRFGIRTRFCLGFVERQVTGITPLCDGRHNSWGLAGRPRDGFFLKAPGISRIPFPRAAN